MITQLMRMMIVVLMGGIAVHCGKSEPAAMQPCTIDKKPIVEDSTVGSMVPLDQSKLPCEVDQIYMVSDTPGKVKANLVCTDSSIWILTGEWMNGAVYWHYATKIHSHQQ